MFNKKLSKSQIKTLTDKFDALDAVDAATANVITQMMAAMNEQRLILNAIVKTLADKGIEVDVPEFDEKDEE
jgi:hypothetical protein